MTGSDQVLEALPDSLIGFYRELQIENKSLAGNAEFRIVTQDGSCGEVLFFFVLTESVHSSCCAGEAESFCQIDRLS